jgi:hypothetical protein
MNNGWFYNHRHGSVKSASEAEIEDLVSSGVLSPDSLLSKNGVSDWKVANQFEELKPFFEKSVDAEDASESAPHIDQSIATPRAGLIDVLKGGVIAESRNNTPIAGDTPKGDSNPELRNPNYAYGFNNSYIYGKARALGFYKIPLYSRKYFENDIPEEVAKLNMEMMKAKQEFDDQRIPLLEAVYQHAKGRFDGFLKGAADAGLELQDLDGIR